MDSTPKTTQARHPWRASVRTAIQAAVGLLLILPALDDQLQISRAWPWLAGLVVFAGAFSRVMANPLVERWLRQHRLLAWLAAAPPEQ